MAAYLIVDSGGDFPSSFVENNQIGILPAKISILGKQLLDSKDINALKSFYEDDLIGKDQYGQSSPWDADEISSYILENVVPAYDTLHVQTLSRSRSKTYDNVNYASSVVNRDFRNFKETGSFSMRVMDTGSVFAGMGVLAIHTQMMLAQGASGAILRKEIEKVKSDLWCYAAVKSIKYLRTQLQRRGDDGISWVSAVFGQALDVTPVLCGHNNRAYSVGRVRGFDRCVDTLLKRVAKQVEAGLVSPHVVVSIAGLVTELEGYQSFKILKETCERHGVELHPCMMGMASAITIGKGSVTVGFAAQAPEFSF